ncbi:MAG TPA: protein kinase [Aridibacter sp.]|nr:protein kinase [Aridibacter sp.]
MTLDPNTTVSHYRILSSIGKGGMGEVYLAQDTKLNRKVAIKFLSDELSRDSDKLNRFVHGAQAASALNHPNIVTVFEISESEGLRYIALESIEGETLTAFLISQS